MGPADLGVVGLHPTLDAVGAVHRGDHGGRRRLDRGQRRDGTDEQGGHHQGPPATGTATVGRHCARSPRSKARSWLSRAWWTSTARTFSPLRRAEAGTVNSYHRLWAAPVTNATALVR